MSAPAYGGKVRAVVLLDEARVTVEEGGRITTTRRRAVRILTREGRREAAARVIYQTGTGKVKGMRGWMIEPGGRVSSYGKGRVMDVEVAPYDVYNDVRAQVIVASDDASPPAVFGYETVLEDRSVFTQFEWEFQDDLPALVSRFSVSVPAGWRADGVVYNQAKLEPTVVGTSFTWQMRDLPPIELEPYGPALTSIAPWLAVSLVPAPGASTGIGRTFEGWPGVARWLRELTDPQAVTSSALADKARSLAREARSERERVQAIGRYVQQVKYVSIQTGVGRGGGYKPHPASEVFAKSYGDCKDKANLMRAMLAVIGIDSYPLAIYLGDPARVRADWPSPQQFNHAIVAVSLKEELHAPAVGVHPGVGRLLFFDPTDPHTPLGLLPHDEEDSLALLVARDGGALLRMPQSPPQANRLRRRLEVTLEANGALAGKVQEEASGHAAASYRAEHQALTTAGYRKRIESWVAGTGSGAQVGSLDVSEGPDDRVRVTVEFRALRYAKSIGGTMLLADADVLPVRDRIALSERKRKYPLRLTSRSFEETMRMKLPEGFEVEEMPRPTHGTAPFGEHSFSCEAAGGYVTCRSSATIRTGLVPVEAYAEARAFFAAANGDQRAPLVLSRKKTSSSAPGHPAPTAGPN